jgi:hypothetical protein
MEKMRAMIKVEWTPATGKYASGMVLKCGPIMVATASYDSMVSKGRAEKYKVRFLLPQLADPEQRYLTIEEAQARAEKGVRSWFSVLELTTD